MRWLAERYEALFQWLPLNTWLGVEAEFKQGLLAGILLVLVLVVLVWAVKWRVARRPSAKGIVVPGEGGDLFITLNAVEEFVTRIMHEFDEASLRSVGLTARSQQLVLNVDIAVVPNTDLVPLRDVLQRRIISGAEEKLGINRPVRVNIRVRSFDADPEKIMKSSRKAGVSESDADYGDLESGR